jgi:hypothetical protein
MCDICNATRRNVDDTYMKHTVGSSRGVTDDESPPAKPDNQCDMGERCRFVAEFYGEVFDLLVDREDDGHRARVREELERAIAQGTDVI